MWQTIFDRIYEYSKDKAPEANKLEQVIQKIPQSQTEQPALPDFIKNMDTSQRDSFAVMLKDSLNDPNLPFDK